MTDSDDSQAQNQRQNYWTDVLAEGYHDIADELEDIAENPDGDDVEKRLNLIAADVREMAEHYERDE